MKKILITLGLMMFAASTLFAAVPSDKKIRLTENWMFLRSDVGSIWETVRPKQKEDVPIWKAVTLPHCFNAKDAVDPDLNYYQGPGWYKTLLDIDNPDANGRILLDFEGAGQKTEVYIHMTKVGSHVGGYDEWFVDITDAVADFRKGPDAKNFNGKIPLSIRCDNSRDTEMMPSDLSDFNVYGGLYRYLNLVYTPQVAFENIHLDARVDNKGAVGTLKATAAFHNPTAYKGAAAIHIDVFDPTGKNILSRKVTPAHFGEMVLGELELKKPMLWSDKTPNLYTCEITMEVAGKSVKTTNRFGFRHTEFVERGPFMLNGQRVLLKGTHRHEDHAGVAAAMTEEMMRREIRMIKDMGANFIRLGHYQQSGIALALCDELGLMVWEEIPWCRGGLGGEEYKEQGRRMLTNMIRQHRNHPAVILWGMGNENDWPGDFPDFDKDKIRAYMKELHDLSHKLDDTRMTAIRRCDFCKDIVDVYSPSIWPGWYGGRFTDYKNATWAQMNATTRFLHVEWGGDSHARRFSENPYKNIDPVDTDVQFISDLSQPFKFTATINVPANGDWSESYICDLFDWILKEQETMPWLTGAANWTFKDFSTPLRPENPVPYVNQKGLVERDLTPKESFYVFQSYWSDVPMIRIHGHEWVRSGDKGEAKQIRVYSNCDEVELFVNGRSQGVKVRNSQDYPAAGLRWDCVLNDGANDVKAVGRKGKGKNAVSIDEAIAVQYQTARWSAPARIEAEVVERGDGYIWVEARLKDRSGIRCLDAADYIDFDYAGDGEMIYDMGTSTSCRRLQAYNGRARIKIEQRAGEKGVIVVKSEGLPSFVLNL